MPQQVVFSILLLTGAIHLLQTLVPHFRRNHPKGGLGAWTVFVIHGLFLLAMMAAAYEHATWGREILLPLQLLGLALLAGKIILKRRCLTLLGEFYSLYIEVRPQQELVTTGPYSFVRHPCFLSSTIEIFAICLIANAWLSMLFFGPLITALYFVRIHIEERILLSFFGDEYRHYKSQVPALLPGLKHSRRFLRNRAAKRKPSLFALFRENHR